MIRFAVCIVDQTNTRKGKVKTKTLFSYLSNNPKDAIEALEKEIVRCNELAKKEIK